MNNSILAEMQQVGQCKGNETALHAPFNRETMTPHLNAQEDDDISILELVDHLRSPRVVQEVYVLKPAIIAGMSRHKCSLLS